MTTNYYERMALSLWYKHFGCQASFWEAYLRRFKTTLKLHRIPESELDWKKLQIFIESTSLPSRARKHKETKVQKEKKPSQSQLDFAAWKALQLASLK